LAVYRRSSRTRNVLAVLVLTALTLVTIDARGHGGGVLSEIRSKVSDAFSPLQSATHDVLRPIGDFLTGAVHYGSLEKENQDLRRQLAQAQTQEAQAQAEKAQAEQILGEQGLPFLGGIKTVTVPVIDVGSSNFDNTVTIGKGRTSGIALGEPVVAAGGLVGTIVNAGPSTATVQLLTDPSFVVGVTLQGGNVGSAQGAGRTLSIHIIVDSTNLPEPQQKVGDIIVTSGLNSEKFPKGLPVGKVTKVTKVAGAIEPDIEISPMVNTAQLSYFDVLLWSPQ
jgi:rod shape-determining protein MreC